jgi:Fic-DOC domain mobile mystery protein B
VHPHDHLYKGRRQYSAVSRREDDLIPDLTTKEELNEWERQNILEAYGWALELRNLSRQDPFTEAYVSELHLRMFDQTWKWAGTYRTTEKNIGIPHYQIREALEGLLGDARYWVEHQTYEPDEFAVRFHHGLVWIYPSLMAMVAMLGSWRMSWRSDRAGRYSHGEVQTL